MINKAIILGNVGSTPTVFNKTGKLVTFSVATTDRVTNKSNGEKEEKTEWHNVAVFGKLADIAEKYIKKGSLVYVEGKMTTNKHEKDGVSKVSHQIIASVVQVLSRKENSSDNDFGSTSYADDTDYSDNN